MRWLDNLSLERAVLTGPVRPGWRECPEIGVGPGVDGLRDQACRPVRLRAQDLVTPITALGQVTRDAQF